MPSARSAIVPLAPAVSRLSGSGALADHRRRAKGWYATVDELAQLQTEYQAWLDALPQALQETATAEALRAICDLDLQELQAVEPPKGFGRD